MMNILRGVWQKFGFLVLAGVVLSGCATLSPEQSEAALRQRIDAYWQARQINDAPTIYRMEAGSLDGSLAPGGVASSVFSLRNVQIGQVSLDHEAGEAGVEVVAEIMMATPGFMGRWLKQKIVDRWVRIDDEWYHRTVRPFAPKDPEAGKNLKPKPQGWDPADLE
jgi:hypothetical protein